MPLPNAYNLTVIANNHIGKNSHLVLPKGPVKEFREQDVEVLLDQAADFLDRGIRDRALWLDLNERMFKVTLDYELEELELKSFPKRLATLGTVITTYNDIVSKQLNNGEIATEGERARKAANPLAQHHYEDAGNYACDDKKYLLYLQKSGFEAMRSSSQASQEELSARSDLTTKSHTLKTEARSSPTGALNYSLWTEPLQKRWSNDFEESLNRIYTAYEGLKKYFGYALKPPPGKEVEEHLLYDYCVIWVRQAISYMIAVKRRDQQISKTISLRRLLNKSPKAWQALIGGGKLDYRLADQDLFGNAYSLLRLRSIAFSIIEEKSTPHDPVDLWSIEATFTRNLTTKLKKKLTIAVPMISARNDIRNPEPFGSSLLYNLSPIGDWHLDLELTSLKGRNAAKTIDDIWMDISCVVQGAENE
jgi:hypothetical protein